MELSTHQFTYQLKKQLNQWVAPFMSEPSGYYQTTIMNLGEVERKLHQYFVNQEPVWITLEYYNTYNNIQEEDILVTVESTINLNRQIRLRDIESDQLFDVATEQILSIDE